MQHEFHILSHDADDDDVENSICWSHWQLMKGMLPIEIGHTSDLPITLLCSSAILFFAHLTLYLDMSCMNATLLHLVFPYVQNSFKSALNHIALNYFSLRSVMLR